MKFSHINLEVLFEECFNIMFYNCHKFDVGDSLQLLNIRRDEHHSYINDKASRVETIIKDHNFIESINYSKRRGIIYMI